MKSRKKKNHPIRAKRYQKKIARQLEYNPLEPRQMLAADFLSAVNYQGGGTDLVNLGNPVHQSEGADLLRAHLTMGSNDSLKLIKHTTDQLGFEHFKYQQHFNNIAVEGSNYTIHVKDSMIVSMSGDRVRVANPIMGVQLSETTALQSAMDHIGASQYAWQDALMSEMLGFDGAPSGDLVYLTNIDGQSVPAYKFDIYAIAPSTRDYVYVNANTGIVELTTSRILEADVNADGVSHYDGTVEFFADSFNDDFRLRQAINGVQTFDNNTGGVGDFSGATDVISSSTTFDDPSTTSGVQAHYGAEVMLQYLLDAFGRNSYDDAGSPLISYVNVSNNLVNAFWNGSVMQYGEGNGTTAGPVNALDVVGHEIAHGVTEFSANLVYANEPGALNESFSDIFGELVESAARNGNNDWLIGGDVFWTSPDDALRSFLDPNTFGQPDTYMGDLWFTGGGDNGGVHTNSGVQNRWFYLLSEGGSGSNDNNESYNVTGIGMDDAAQIAYRNLTTYLGVNSQYQAARDGAVQSAIDLYGEGSDQHVATNLAWRAVGVYGDEIEIYDVAELLPGSLIYQGEESASVDNTGPVPVDISLEAGQTIGITVAGSNGLVPMIEVMNPNGAIIGSATASGNTVVISNLPVLMAGKYTILVDGDNGTEGDFDITVLLNASIETEGTTGFSNGAMASAQDIDSTSYAFSLPGGNVANRIGSVGEFSLDESPDLDADGFESGIFSGQWSTLSSDPLGRIQISDQYGAAEGSFALLMDQRAAGGFSTLNQAVWTIDLSGTTNPLLSFYHAEWNDETTTLPAIFNNSINGDGVSVSADGIVWYTVLTDTETPAGQWSQFTINLGDIASANGLALTSDFKIKFQQYDDGQIGSDGRGYDDIQIKSSVVSDDWYSFSLDEGETASLAARKFEAAGQIGIELYDSSGTLLETGSANAELDSQISQFTAGETDTYFARLTGKSTGYAFVTTRGLAFDTGSTLGSPQEFGSSASVLGFAGAVADAVADADEAVDKALVNNYFAGITLSNAVTGGDVFAAIAPFDGPSGTNVFAPGPSSPSGWQAGTNELRIDFDILQSSVRIDVGSDDGNNDMAFLRAYDADGNLIDQAISQSLPAGESQTLRVRDTLGEIAYVIAAGLGNDVAPLGNIQFEVAAEKRDFYAIDVEAGQALAISAQFPGSDPLLFNNRLVTSNGVQFRMELTNTAGQIVAQGEDLINFIPTETESLTLVVYADTGEGDYLLSVELDTEIYYDVGPLGYGIAVDDSATGTGFLMFSVESVHTRFASRAPLAANADHLVAVRFNADAGTWEYNNNSRWSSFVARAEDRLLAEIDFSGDTIDSLQGASRVYQGIMVGFTRSDLTFTANQWKGAANPGEFEAVGTYFTTNDSRTNIDELNYGIDVVDNATGTGYLMYSEESIHTRMATPIPPLANHSSHLIAVRFNSGLGIWEFNSNRSSWYAFSIASTDRLIAAIDFDADTIVGLKSVSGAVFGINQGYTVGDLVFQANSWNNSYNEGEFQVTGSFFTTTDNQADIGELKKGIAVEDNATGTGFVMYSSDSVHLRFASDAPFYNNSDHMIAVRYNSGISSWEYNNNQDWIAFTLAAGDRLLASVDFDANSINSFEGTNSTQFGMSVGYQSGDLTFFAEQWNGEFNAGEFQVLGTYFLA